MEEKQVPGQTTYQEPAAAGSLESFDDSSLVSSFTSLPENNYQVDNTLEVHAPDAVQKTEALANASKAASSFSKRKSLIVSVAITIIVTLFTGVSALLLGRNAPNTPNTSASLTVPVQDIGLTDDRSLRLPSELQGSSESLLIAGDVITRGSLKFSNNSFVAVLKSTALTADQTLTLPDTSGTLCLDSNNCNFADLGQLGQLDGRIAQLGQQLNNFIVSADAGVTSVNNQTGSISVQGSLNRISVSTAGGIVTLTTPQDLDANANVQFGNLTLGAGGSIRANSIQQTAAGNNLAISAGADSIVFTSGGRTFTFPASGPAAQTICTDGITCASGGGIALILSPNSVQVDDDADNSIFINDTGGGNLIQIQSQGVDRLVVDNVGNTTIAGSLTVSSLGNGFVRSTGGALSVVSAIDLSSSDVTNTLPVGRGGTGAASLNANGVLVGNGVSPVSAVTAGAAGLCLVSNAGSPTFQVCPGTGDVTDINGLTGSVTLQGTANQVSVSTGAGVITLSTPQDINTAASPTFASLTLSGLGNGVVRVSAGTLTTGLVSLTSEVSGTLPVGNGGTGLATTPTNGQLLIGNGTNYTLASLTQGAGIAIANGAGSITITSAFGSEIDLGTETAGDYVSGFSGGAGVNVTGSGGEGSTPTIALILQASKGLEVDANGLSLIDCAADQILKYNVSNQWVCSTDVDTTGSFNVAGDTGIPESVANGDTLTIQGGNNIATTVGSTDTITVATVNNPTFTTSVTTPLLQSSGALSITPNGALTVGATGQTALLQGSTTTITSNGVGNDIVLTTADQIRLTGFDCTAFANGGTLTTDTSGNVSCANDDGPASDTVTGTGTANRIALFTGANTVADSWLLQNGSTLELDNTRNLSVTGGNFSVAGTGLFTGLITASGGITVETGDTFTFNGEAFTDLTGTGLTFNSGSLQTTLGTSVDLTTEVVGVLPVVNGGTGIDGSAAANGTLLIGNGTGYTLATLTAGSGITVNNSAGGIEIVNFFGTSIESGEITDLTITGADIADDTITLGTKTTGSYIATITGNAQVGVSGSGSETAAVTLSLVADSIGDAQLAFDTGQNLTVTSSPTFNGLTLSGNLAVEGGNASLGNTLQAGTLTLSDGSSNTGSLQTANLGQDTAFTLPDPGAATATICLSTGNCAGAGGGVTTSGGTANRIAFFNGAQTIADSWLLQNGSTLQLDNTRNLELLGGNLTITGNQTTSGSVTFSGLTNGFLEVNGTGVVAVGTIDLGADTAGNYVATVTAGNGISGSSNTEGGTPTIALSNLTADWIQSGAFDMVLSNAGAEIRILESVGGTFYGTFDVGDLTADQTYTFLQGGDVVTSGNVSSYATTGVTAGNGLTGGGTTGILTVNIGAGNGILVNADDIAVVYGNTANTAVEGDTQITVTAGTNLTGGGTITLGAGGTLTVNVADSPTFAGNVTVQGGTVTVGTATQAGNVSLSDGSSSTATLQTNPLAQNTAFNLIDPGQASVDICLSTGNCAGAGGGVTTSGGTANRIAIFNGAQTVADSWLLQNGSTLQLDNTRNLELLGGNLTITGNQTTSGTVTFSGLANGFLEANGTGVLSIGTIDLGADTAGNYVATITAGNGISGSSSTEGGTPTIALGNLSADWIQSGAFDIVMGNSGAEIRILENGLTPSFYGTFDVGDLSSDQTYTFLQGGDVLTSGNVSAYATTGVTAGSGLTGGGTTGILTVNIGAGNGITVNADDISVVYGSTANTAVEGDTQITVTAGTNLTGGGTITLGAGGTLTVNVADSPTFAGSVTVQGGSVTVGTATQAGTVGLSDGSSNTGTLQTAGLGQNTAFTLPDPGAAAATICLSTGNCAGAGGGVTTSGGTANRIAMFNGGQTIADSWLLQNGSTLQLDNTRSLELIGGNLVLAGGNLSVTGNQTTSGTVTFSALANGFLEVNGSGVVSVGAIDLGADTTGNYVATITAGNGISGSATGEGSTPTIALGPLTADWVQSGAFDIVLNDSGAEMRILESGLTPSFYGTFDVGDLSADQTYTFLQGGTIVSSGNVSSFATTGVTAGNGLTGGGTTGVLTLDIGAGNGITVNANDIAVIYGSTANTAVQGNTSLTVTAGTNLSGGGSITLGAGGTVTLNVADSPTFAGTVTVQGSTVRIGTASTTTGSLDLYNATSTFAGSIQVASLGQATLYTLPDPGAATATICLSTGNCAGSGGGVTTAGGTANQLAKFSGAQTIADSTISDNGTNVTTSVNVIIQGGNVSLGTTTQAGTVTLSDGSSNTATIALAAQAGNYTYTIPDAGAADEFCIRALGNCSGAAGGNAPSSAQYLTLALDAGLSAERTLSFNGTNFTVSDGGANGAYSVNTVQNIATTSAPSFAGLTLTGNLSMGTNTIQGTTAVIDFTNFDVASTGAVTAGTYNGQTISATASFTGTVAVAGLTTLSGGLTVEAGDTFTFNGDAFTDLTGNGLQVSTGSLTLAIQANKGLEVDASGLSLVDCATDGYILKYNLAGGTWSCAADAGGSGVGDDVSLNGTNADGANFLNTAASGTVASTTWSLNAVSSPDDITLVIGTASGTEAGIVNTSAQAFAGAKTFNGSIIAGAGVNLGTQTLQGTTAVINFDNFDVSSTGAVTAVGVNAGSGLIQGTGGITIAGTATFSSLTNGFLEVNGTGVVSVGTIDLGTDTAGNYVATITSGNGVSAAATGEGSTPTIALSNLTADWLQSGAFDIVLDNSASELKIKESGLTPTFYAILDTADLSADQTFMLNEGGTVVTSGNVATYATTAVTAGTGLTGGGTVGALALNIASANGGIVVNANDIALTLQANKGLEVDANGLSLVDCANGEILKYNTTGGTWGCAADAGAAGTGDDVLVNGTNADGANFLNTTASASVAGVSISLNAVATPDEISLQISDASGTLAGIVTANAQTFGGNKTFNGQIVAGAGINMGATTLSGTTAVIDFNNFDVSSAGAVTAVGVNAGTGLLQGTGGITVAGTVTFSSLTNGFLEVNASGVVSVGTIDLGTDTTGNYVATITAGNGISGSATGEGSTPTIALSNLTADWIQSGAFDLVLNNSASELKILESGVTPTFYAIFDAADLTADQTFLFETGGTVVTSGNVATYATTAVTAGTGLAGGGTVGALTLNVASANGGIVVNANDIALTLQANKGLEVDANGLSLIDCANGELLKYNTTGGTWGCAADAGAAGTGDDVLVNGTNADGANFANTAASATAVATTWSLNTGTTPDTINLALGVASATEAGIVTANAQSFGGVKTFEGQIIANAGVNMGTQTLQGTTAIIDFTNFDVDASGNLNTAGTIGIGGTTRINTSGTFFGATGSAGTPSYNFSGETGNNTGMYLVANDELGFSTGGTQRLLIDASGNAFFTGAGDVALSLTVGTNDALQITSAGNMIFEGATPDAFEFTVTVADPSADRTYTIPNSTAATDTFCLVTLGNCAGTGSGVTTAGGTTNRIAKFSGTQAIADSSISDNGTVVTVLGSTDLTVEGGEVTVGTTSLQGGLVLHDGNGQTTTLRAGNSVGNLAYTLPDADGSNSQCLKTNGLGVWSFGNCNNGSGSGGAITLQDAYDAGNTIATTDNRHIGFTLADTTNDSNFLVNIATGSTGKFAVQDNAVDEFRVDSSGAYALSLTLGNALGISYGGTAATTAQGAINNISGLTTNGDLLYHNGTNSTRLARGTNGQCLTSNATTILWGACGSGGDGGVLTVGTFSTTNTAANGATISGTEIIFQSASATAPGMVDTGSQSFAGAKTFNASVTIAANQTINLTGGTTASRPASPTEGMLYFDTTTKQLLTYSNGKWQATNGEYVIVAASNSSQTIKDAAHYVADGNTAAAADGDQVQINAALTAAAGGKVYLAQGTYVADATILIPNNTTLAGAGRGTLIELADLDVNENLIENSDTTTGTGVAMQDLRLDGRSDLNTAGTQHGIYFSGMGAGSGVSARQGAKLSSLWINNFRSYGFQLFGSNSTVSGVTTLNNGSAGFYLGSGSYNAYTGNIAQGNSYGFFIASHSRSNFTGNVAQANAYGIYLTSSTNNTLASNTVHGNTYGVYLASSANNVVTANKLDENGSTTDNNALFIDASDSNTITSNSITDSSATTTNYAINVSNSTSDTNYLADNTLGGGSINDAGTGTIYGGQVDSAGNYDIQPSGSISLLKNTAVTGTLSVSSNATVSGSTLTVGAAATAGRLVLHDGSGQTATIQLGNIAANSILTLPATLGATDTFCFLTLNNCAGTGDGGVLTVGTFSTTNTAANGATISGTEIIFQSASASAPGMVDTGAQTFAGAKTFNASVTVVSNLTVDTNTLFVDATLNTVGIGTASTEYKLHVVSDGAANGGGFISNDVYGTVPVFQGRRANGTLAAPTAITTGDTIAQFSARGYDGTSWSGTRAAIIMAPTQNWSSTAHGTSVSFYTTQNDTTSLQQRMILSNEGYLGLGTGSALTPTALLHVERTATSLSGTVNQVYSRMDVNPASDSSAQFVSGNMTMVTAGASNLTGLLSATYGLLQHSGTGALSNARGNSGYVYNSSTGTIADASGVYGSVIKQSTGAVTTAKGVTAYIANSDATGAITSARAFSAETPGATGAITNAYGLYIENQAIANVTNAYGVYQAGANTLNYFAGNVGIGDTSPAYLLTVGNGDLFGVNGSGQLLFEGATVDANQFTVTVADPTADRTYTIPNSTATTDTFCLLTLANCSGSATTLQASYDADTDGGDAIITLTAADGGILFRDASTALGTTLFAVQDNTGATGYLTVSAATTAIGNNLTVTGSGTFNGNVTVGDASSDTLTVAATSTFNAAVTVNATQTVNTDSGSAFRINNSTSGEVLNVDTTNSQVTINGQNQEDIRNWAATTAIPWARQDAASAVYNGYVYSTGGAAGVTSTPDTNMSKAKINPDGSLGSWASVGMLAARQEHIAVAYQGYLYIISGNANTALSPNYQNNVWVAKINPDDGGVGAGMRGLTALPTGLRLARGLAYNGYIYVVGGNNGATVSTVYYAKVLSDGSLGTWNTATAGLPAARQSHDVVVANGRMYVIGGYNGSAQSSVYFGTIGSDGNITGWTTATNPLPEARSDHASFVQNGYIYVTGGGSSGATNTVYYSKINSSTGQPGTWATSTVLPATRLGHNVETYNGYVYLMGGSYTTNVYYGSGPRTKVAGTLDLTTVGGSDIMSANGMAGVLSAGDTNVLGDLRVTQSSLFLGDANFANDVVIDSPDAQLMVVNKISGGEVLPLKLHNDTSTTGSKVAIDFGVSQVYNTTTAKIGVERMDGGAGDIYFNNYNGSTLIETMRIQSDGDLAVDTNTLFVDAVNNRVGIGDGAPGYKLEVAGTSGGGYFGITNSTDGDIFNINGSGNATFGGTVAVQGSTATIGTATVAGSLVLNDGSGQTASIQLGNITANTVLTLPATLGATDTFCFQTLANCGGGGPVTLQQAYDNSASPATITTSSTTKDFLVQAGSGFDSGSTFQVKASNGNNVMRVDTSGERLIVGITSAPEAKVHVLTAGMTTLRAYQGGSFDIMQLANATANVMTVGSNGATVFQNTTNSTTAFNVMDTAGASLLNVDTTNGRVGIGTAAPEFKLQVAGAGNNFVSNDAYAGIGVFQGRRANGTQAAPTALADNEVITQLSARGHDGSAFSGTRAAITLQTIGAWTGTSQGTAIRFQVTDSSTTTLVQQAGLNSDGSFVIANSDVSSGGARLRVVAHSASTIGTIIQGTSTQTADLLKLKRDTLDVLTVAGTGAVVMRNSANSTDAFQVQNASSQRVLGVNTTAGEVTLGTGSTLAGKLVVYNATNSNTVTLTVGATSASYTLTLPTSVGSANQCLQNSATPGILTWAACGGSGSSTKTVKILAEYAGGILSADGTSNTGTMAANHDSTARRNYYEWTTTQGTAQDYDVVATVQMPSDFVSIGAASGFKFYMYDGDGATTTAKVTWTIIDGGGTQCFSTDFNGAAANTWEQKSASSLGTCTFSANSEVTFRFKLTTTSGAGSIRIGGFEYQYSN